MGVRRKVSGMEVMREFEMGFGIVAFCVFFSLYW